MSDDINDPISIPTMELTKLGRNADLNQQFAPHYAKGLVPARVAVEDKHFFRVWTADSEFLAQVSGKCIHEARRSNSRFPKVGDWVAVKLVSNEEKAVIQAILPRRTQLSRKMTGHGATEHILATNIDTASMVPRRINTRCSKPLPSARSRASGMTVSSSFNSKSATSAKLRREPPGKTAKRATVTHRAFRPED